MKDATRTQSFTYDLLNRLATAQEGSRWSNAYAYDAWGNLGEKLYRLAAANRAMQRNPVTDHPFH